jgi:aminoglycoside phosphotransferase family enzyme
VRAVHSTLRHYRDEFRRRALDGRYVDGHGDLHVDNIFIEDGVPILFDCLEFSDELRRIDVLDELAFLYVDLESWGRIDLAHQLAASYSLHARIAPFVHATPLFDYYRCYRANIRLKVMAVKLNTESSGNRPQYLVARLKTHFGLFLKYLRRLTTAHPRSAATTTRKLPRRLNYHIASKNNNHEPTY